MASILKDQPKRGQARFTYVMCKGSDPTISPPSPPHRIEEAEALYHNLVVLESDCVECVNLVSPLTYGEKLDDRKWRFLFVVHRELLILHFDILYISRYSFAVPSIRQVDLENTMPARMWRYGIHPFLELLRQGLPESREHMNFFWNYAYNLIAHMYELLPPFRAVWARCLGDLARYRMAIGEDDFLADPEIWADISRQWYVKAGRDAGKRARRPKAARQDDHLTTPDAVQQLYCKTKELCATVPLRWRDGDILPLFEPRVSSATASSSTSDSEGEGEGEGELRPNKRPACLWEIAAGAVGPLAGLRKTSGTPARPTPSS